MTAALLPLWPFRRETVDAVTKAWADGMRRPAVVLPCSSGKTVIFSHLIAEYVRGTGRRALVLINRDELADQTLDAVRGVAPDLDAGKIKAGDDDIRARVMVASVQTLSRDNRLARLLRAAETDPVGMVITDECFPAGTLVGGTPIEDLRPGDVVPTWNEDTGREEPRPVRHVMSKAPGALVRVSLTDGTSIACTPNHPILTDAGWCPAGMLRRDASVVSFTHDASAETNGMHPVRRTGQPYSGADQQLEEVGQAVLWTGVCPGDARGIGAAPEKHGRSSVHRRTARTSAGTRGCPGTARSA